MIPPTIVEFVEDPQLLGLTLSPAQGTLLKAIYGRPLGAEELALWQRCTGRQEYPGQPFPEVTVIAGARSGKDSRIAAPIALYEALFGGHDAHLAKGERGIIPLVAQDQRATRVAFSYIRDYVTGAPLLAELLEEEREAELRFTNRMTVLCFASTAKSIRGWSIPAAVMDELAFFRVETGSDTDVEIQTAIRRGMVGFAHPRLVKVSTPYVKGGVLYEDFRTYFAQPSADVLVWQAPTTLMNPTITERRLAREARVDAQRYAREYEALFSDDVESFLPGAWIEAATVEGRHELPPLEVA